MSESLLQNLTRRQNTQDSVGSPPTPEYHEQPPQSNLTKSDNSPASAHPALLKLDDQISTALVQREADATINSLQM